MTDKPANTGSDTVSIPVPRDLVEALDAFAREEPGMTMQEAVRLALREWAIGKGLIPVEPTESIPLGELNASNDV